MQESSLGRYQLCFRPLFQGLGGFVFPCDQRGIVDLDHLTEKARNNYFYARAMMGRELAFPQVEAAGAQ